MIQKSEYFEQADLFINSEMSQTELNEFEAQMAIDPDLAKEVNLQKEVQQASCEQDVLDLRANLSQIVQNQSDVVIREKIESTLFFKFDLAENSTENKKFDQINLDHLSNIENSFPKIHLYQHKVAGKENLHQFYKEQFNSGIESNEEEEFNPFDEKLLDEVQLALNENDIVELRANLKQVAQSIPAHNYSSEEIDDYIYNQMESESRRRFEEELSVNSNLACEVALIKDIDVAIAENDILDLRANLNRIQHSEIQLSTSMEDLEKYINNEFSLDEMAMFEAEISSSKKLQEEIDLIKNIDKALSETDIMQLRNNLQSIATQIDENRQKERSFIGKLNLKQVISSATVAASIVLLLAFTGILSGRNSSSEIYKEYYTKYGNVGITRSADRTVNLHTSASLTENTTFALALEKYENKEYTEALNLFGKVISTDPKNIPSHFYSGVSLQEKGKFNKAIQEYEYVIINKDNLFTEQAEWYTGLCLLRINDNKKAYRQFKKIAQSKGFYQEMAGEVLKKIKYSD